MKTQSTCQLWIIALVFVTICVATIQSEGSNYKRVCYFTNWSKYRLGDAKFTADKIDPFLCTHLIFAFGDFDEQGNLKEFDWNDSQDYETFRGLKQKNPKLRTLLAIGGWNFGSEKYSNMVENPHTRKTFVTSTVSFLRSNGFDGLDIDWEYPAERGGAPQDKPNLVSLCKELKDAFTTEAQQTGRESLILTAAVPADRHKVQSGYDVQSLNNYLDFINIMTYDFHGSWESKTGQNSPLYPSPIYEHDHRYLNIRDSAKFWNESGIPKHKLIVGLASYGRTFRLTSQNSGLGAPAAEGSAGPFTRQAGFWSYYEICMDIENDRNGPRLGNVYYDAQQEVPYYVKGDLWLGYDNEQSIKAKTKWIKENGYGGFMVWTLALDDFKMMCRNTTKPYPLIHAAIEELGVTLAVPTQEVLKQSIISESQGNTKPATTATTSVQPSVTTSAPSQVSASQVNTKHFVSTNVAPAATTLNGETPVQPSVTIAAPSQKVKCPHTGHIFLPDSTSCEKYIECYRGIEYSKNCPPDLHWDTTNNFCNWPDKANCLAG